MVQCSVACTAVRLVCKRLRAASSSCLSGGSCDALFLCQVEPRFAELPKHVAVLGFRGNL
jgi:hypothetical protein